VCAGILWAVSLIKSDLYSPRLSLDLQSRVASVNNYIVRLTDRQISLQVIAINNIVAVQAINVLHVNTTQELQ